jgi:hypothetical protein
MAIWEWLGKIITEEHVMLNNLGSVASIVSLIVSCAF